MRSLYAASKVVTTLVVSTSSLLFLIRHCLCHSVAGPNAPGTGTERLDYSDVDIDIDDIQSRQTFIVSDRPGQPQRMVKAPYNQRENQS